MSTFLSDRLRQNNRSRTFQNNFSSAALVLALFLSFFPGKLRADCLCCNLLIVVPGGGTASRNCNCLDRLPREDADAMCQNETYLSCAPIAQFCQKQAKNNQCEEAKQALARLERELRDDYPEWQRLRKTTRCNSIKGIPQADYKKFKDLDDKMTNRWKEIDEKLKQGCPGLSDPRRNYESLDCMRAKIELACRMELWSKLTSDLSALGGLGEDCSPAPECKRIKEQLDGANGKKGVVDHICAWIKEIERAKGAGARECTWPNSTTEERDSNLFWAWDDSSFDQIRQQCKRR